MMGAGNSATALADGWALDWGSGTAETGTGVAGTATSIVEFAVADASGVESATGADSESAAGTSVRLDSTLLVVDAKGGGSGGRLDAGVLTLGLGASSKSVHMGGAGAARCETKAKTRTSEAKAERLGLGLPTL